MLKKFITIAKYFNINRIILEVKESNKIAYNLYQKNGFKINRIRKQLYKNEEDAFEMILKLK
jgi:ribosomal protein S18 acetylase RimI-like enzyme